MEYIKLEQRNTQKTRERETKEKRKWMKEWVKGRKTEIEIDAVQGPGYILGLQLPFLSPS